MQYLLMIYRNEADLGKMDAAARKWLSRNRSGVRHLRKQDLDTILDVGERAFNLRVADPYLRWLAPARDAADDFGWVRDDAA